jgi:hypothetical protein
MKIIKIIKNMERTLLRHLNALGKNLSIDKYKVEYRSKLNMPSYLNQVLIGLLLSDGYLEKSSPTSLARLSVMFGSLHISYLLHLFNLFEPYTDSLVRTIDTFNKRTQTSHVQIGFKTVSLPIFLIYHKMFYIYDDKLKKYIKIVPSNIESLISPIVLAHLIMGDGNFKSKDKIIRIYTNSFIKSDVERLGNAITNKLGILTKTVCDRNNQYMLTISKNQLDTVKSLILPYMHESMLYKLGLDSTETKRLCFKLENHLGQI